uniref:SH3 domain-containing protein n=1 Tax=Stomoxys calcitrans TaxID=35570 RepID=A0A1I8QAY5_STOCA
MGQNLSIRRPRISLTWVLREQQQQQTPQPDDSKSNAKDSNNSNSNDSHKANTNNNQVNGKLLNNLEVSHTNALGEKKKYRLKKSSNENAEPLNGYATTPTSYTNASIALGSQKFFSNQNLLEYHKDENGTKPPSKDLLFVCTPQRLPDGFGGSTEALALVKKRNEIRKKLAAKMAQFRAETQASQMNGAAGGLKKESSAATTKASLKSGSYSEPSLIAASEGNSRRHRHRKRRERNRPPKFGYDIKNVDEFLTKCSLASPANIPMVLSTSCILYQTRPGGYQTEISLPLGMVINAVFKNQNWLYVQTPHAEEGYVNYTTCLPLGILPAEARREAASGKGEHAASTTTSGKSKACWETIGDVFPKPCGNMTDSEKEIHLRVGTRSRSEGARTPHLKSTLTDNDTVTVISVNTENTDCLNGNSSSIYGEQQVDKLYLRAASQPKLSEKTSYAQLKIIRQHSSAASGTSTASKATAQLNDEYVTLQQQQKSMQKQHIHHLPAQKTYITRTFITNGHNGQHLHPKDMNMTQNGGTVTATAVVNNCNNLKNPTVLHNNGTTTSNISISSPYGQQQQNSKLHYHQQQQQHHHHHHHQSSPSTTTTTTTSLHHINAAAMMATATTVAPRSILNAIRRSSAHCGQRQTLVAITTDYSTGDGLSLQKGDIVTLCECRETKDHRQWFYVRTRDGRQGYIPAEVAGHGYL